MLCLTYFLFQLSWLRHSLPIPQLLGLNNITNTLNPRYKAVVSGGWSEFVLVIKDVRPRDSGTYECQISGPKHSSLKKLISLTVIGDALLFFILANNYPTLVQNQ